MLMDIKYAYDEWKDKKSHQRNVNYKKTRNKNSKIETISEILKCTEQT